MGYCILYNKYINNEQCYVCSASQHSGRSCSNYKEFEDIEYKCIGWSILVIEYGSNGALLSVNHPKELKKRYDTVDKALRDLTKYKKFHDKGFGTSDFVLWPILVMENNKNVSKNAYG